MVAPLAGAWIEIILLLRLKCSNHVAPLAGAWIEIFDDDCEEQMCTVAPLAGAWIEIVRHPTHKTVPYRRSPRGSVD